MKNFKFLLITLLGATLFLTSCQDDCKDINCNDNGVCLEGLCECDEGYTGVDCETSIPLLTGSEIVLSTTVKAPFNGNMETEIGSQFNQGAGAGDATATLGEGVEFADYGFGLFDIDVDASSITFKQVGEGTTVVWGSIVDAPLGADTFVKFSFDLDKSMRISQYTVTDNTTGATIPVDAVNVFLDNTNNVVIVELSAGFPMGLGDLFTVNFE